MPVLNVPYRSQWDRDADKYSADCGPTCLAMVLNYHEVSMTPNETYRLMGPHKPHQYVALSTLITAAQRRELQIQRTRYDAESALARLKTHIDAGEPLIALVKYAPWQTQTGHRFRWGHFVVVVGYDEQHVYVHDPLFGLWQKRNRGERMALPTELFLAGWGGFSYLENPNWLCGVVSASPTESILEIEAVEEARSVDEDIARRVAALAAYRFAFAPDLSVASEVELWTSELGDWGAEYDEHVVQAGENFGRIAYTYFGDGSRWKALAAYNDRAESRMIWVGETLRVPRMGTSGAETTDALPASEINSRGDFDVVPPSAYDYDALGEEGTIGLGYELGVETEDSDPSLPPEGGRGIGVLSAQRDGFSSSPSVREKIEAGTAFTPTWTFINNGDQAWTGAFRFQFVETSVRRTRNRPNSAFSPQPSYTLAELGVTTAVEPGQQVALTLNLIAPATVGYHATHWQLHDENGTPFGDVRWVLIGVKESAAPVEPVPPVVDPEKPETPVDPEPPVNPTFPLKNKLTKHAIGMTMSHYEFDIDQLDNDGRVQNIPVRMGGKPYKSYRGILNDFDVLRFMNWQKTNVSPIWENSPNQNPEFYPPPHNISNFQAREKRDKSIPWRELLLPSRDPNQFKGGWHRSVGVPLKICLETAKHTNSNPWICIPHGNSLAQFNTLLDEMLRITFESLKGTALTPIFEFSNEVWNGGRFWQQKECAALAEQTPGFNVAGLNQGNKAYAWQIARTNDIKRKVGSRGFVVIGAWANKPDHAESLLKGINGYVLDADIDALAIAPYIGNARDSRHVEELFPHSFHPLISLKTGEKIELTGGQLHQNLLAYVEGTWHKSGTKVGGETKNSFMRHRQIVDDYNKRSQRTDNRLRLWTYEGGVDLNYASVNLKSPIKNRFSFPRADEAALLKWNNDKEKEIVALYNEYHHSPLAGELMRRVLSLWDTFDGELFCGYSSATRYAGEYNKPDYFGYIDLVNGHYDGTYKLKQLLDRKC